MIFDCWTTSFQIHINTNNNNLIIKYFISSSSSLLLENYEIRIVSILRQYFFSPIFPIENVEYKTWNILNDIVYHYMNLFKLKCHSNGPCHAGNWIIIIIIIEKWTIKIAHMFGFWNFSSNFNNCIINNYFLCCLRCFRILKTNISLIFSNDTCWLHCFWSDSFVIHKYLYLIIMSYLVIIFFFFSCSNFRLTVKWHAKKLLD